MPSGSARVLGVVRRETIKDPNFYHTFFALIDRYVQQERAAQEHRRRPSADERQADAGK
jgi:uncharacterized protein YbjQ (UPF0145 family)